MITLRTRDINKADYPAFLSLYEEAFPADERRPYDSPRDLGSFLDLKRGRFRCLVAQTPEGEFLGFLTYWKFGDFIYIEHFATVARARGHGIGAKMIDDFLCMHETPVLIEVEKPDNDMARRRIAFYERHGFRLHPAVPYVQPPYSPALMPVEMMLMTRGEVDCGKAAGILREAVYGVSPGIGESTETTT